MTTQQTLFAAGLLALLFGCSESAQQPTGGHAEKQQPAAEAQAGMAHSGDSAQSSQSAAATDPTPQIDVTAILKASMTPRNGVGYERLEQNRMQKLCSQPGGPQLTAQQRQSIRSAAMESVVYPENGDYLGDWKQGMEIARNGRGLQYSDDPAAPNGGNCYACHQIGPQVIAYGNLGPSLAHYGQRGRSEQMLKYTWAKIWNPHAYIACSHMPRFGDAGILTPDQIRDVMALLLDPASPVNSAPQQ
ncbi:MAG: sulfur oxidation c-type cytochrome SoxX [Salinisphaera sp.]|nr:sulfur oxidation c-type cytochrome SoxX [Salinisphaera sp.]